MPAAASLAGLSFGLGLLKECPHRIAHGGAAAQGVERFQVLPVGVVAFRWWRCLGRSSEDVGQRQLRGIEARAVVRSDAASPVADLGDKAIGDSTGNEFDGQVCQHSGERGWRLGYRMFRHDQ